MLLLPTWWNFNLPTMIISYFLKILTLNLPKKLRKTFAKYITSKILLPTCYKNLENPTMIDLFFTNNPNSSQNSTKYETSLSDFQKMTFTILQAFFKKQSLKIISYRNYSYYNKSILPEQLLDLRAIHISFFRREKCSA